MKKMLQNWELACDKVHVVVSYNASGMIRAVRDASFTHIGLFTHFYS